MALRSLRQLLVVFLFTGTLWAATDPFAGTWKLNPAKSKLSDQMKVEEAGPNRFTFIFSGDNSETIVADGTDQPGIFGTTFAVTVLSPRQWKVVRKGGGRLMVSAIWDLSADGNTLTDNFTGYRADGSTSNLLYRYTRTAGTSGFAGTWEPAGYATSGRRASDRAVELTDKINGKVLDTQQVEVSPDGKILTITTQIPGHTKPNVQVFDRE